MEIKIDYLEKDFNKERNYNDNSEKLLCNGLTGKSRHKLTPDDKAYIELYVPPIKNLIANYQKEQNTIGKLKQEEQIPKEISESILNIFKEIISPKEITGATESKYKEHRFDAAENYASSPCCRLIVLDELAKKLNEDSLDERDAVQVEALIARQQERFSDYQFGSNVPIDKNADVFFSHMIPTILTYYGYKINDSFTNSVFDMLEKNKMEIPEDLKDLKREINMKQFEVYSAPTLKDSFENYNLESDYKACLLSPKTQTFDTLYKHTKSFISISDNASLDEIRSLTDDENFADYLQIVWEIEHNVKDTNSMINQTKNAYDNFPTKKQKQGDAWNPEFVKLVVLYSPMDCLAREKRTNKINAEKIVKKAEEEAREKARQEAEEQARKAAEKKKAKRAEAAKKAAETRKQKEAEEKARLAKEEKERQEAEEKARKEAEEQARKEAEEQARLAEEEKQKHNELVFAFAKELFLSQDGYNLEDLRNFVIVRTIKAGSSTIVKEIRPFEDVSSKDAKEEIKEKFLDLAEHNQRGFFELYLRDGETSFLSAADEKLENMMKNYAKLSAKDKKLIDNFGKEHPEIASQINSNLRSNRMQELMEKYNLPAMEVDNNDLIEQGIIDFISGDAKKKFENDRDRSQ